MAHRRSASRKSRKTHRRSHRHHKGSRSAHRKGSRSAHRKGSRRQHGGASCAAQPLFNTNPFAQKGGMAPISATDDYLIDAASRVQAQTAPLDGAFAELNTVIPRQTGGRRRRSARRSRSRKAHRKSHRKGSRSAHRRHGSRKQRGGALADFNGPHMLTVAPPTQLNPQWEEYYPAKGAQAV